MTKNARPARTVTLTMGPDPDNTLLTLPLAFPEGDGLMFTGTYPDAEGTGLPDANLYLYIDGMELGSLFLHRDQTGRIVATLGRYEEATMDWEPRESLPETSWRPATEDEIPYLEHDGEYDEEPIPSHIVEYRGDPEHGWMVRV